MIQIEINDCINTNGVEDYNQLISPDTPSGSLLFWADRLLQIKQDIEDHNLEIKRLNNLLDNAEHTLFDMMTSNQIEQFKRNGYSFSPTVKTRASIKSENKEQAMEWLKQSNFADIVKETVNAQTLTSMVREWKESGITEEIEPFFEMLNLYDDRSISIRKGR